MTKLLEIGRVTASHGDGHHRVEAAIAGTPLWFTSADTSLRASSEGLATALLVPSLHSRRRLRATDPVCPRWAGHLDPLLDLLHRWWDCPVLKPELRLGPAAGAPSPRVGLCFTGGVDSFFSLLRYPRPIDTLVHFVPSAEQHKASRFEGYLREVAAARGIRAIVVRSNLRDHPAFRGPSWGQTHGAALAAVGHLLADHLGTLVVSSSYPYCFSRPWGSHFELDHMWSSSRLEVSHFGATHWRTQKLEEIAGEPLVQTYLNPCSKRSAQLNCSRCEKCLRTQLVLLTCGQWSRFSVFDRRLSLAEQANRLGKISNPGLFPVYEKFLTAGLPDDVASAVQRLLKRSHRYAYYVRWKGRCRRLFGLPTPGREHVLS